MRQIHLKKIFYSALLAGCILGIGPAAFAQTPLLLSEAVRQGIQHYQNIEAKRNYLKASQALVKNTQNEYLPNVIAGIQQVYGTVNGQFGPLTAAVTGPASSGPVYTNQSWNAGFGATYLVNTNWEVFSFGRLQSKIRFFEMGARKDSADLLQEEFIQSIKISGAYLNLLIAGELKENSKANLERAEQLQNVVLARTRNGLNAGVDSSIANAEVSSARLSVISAQDNEQVLQNQLSQLLNADPINHYLLDSNFFKAIPAQLQTQTDVSQNPQVKYYQSRIEQSNQAVDYLKKVSFPA